MALQGLQNFKGIELSNAYLRIVNFNYFVDHSLETSIKTPAVMEEDGITIKTEAVYESNWVNIPKSECLVKVFKDKEARDSDPSSSLYEFIFKLDLSISEESKNPIKQSYLAIKSDERFEDFIDV